MSLPEMFPKKVPSAGRVMLLYSPCGHLHLRGFSSGVTSASLLCCSVAAAQEKQPQHILIPHALVQGRRRREGHKGHQSLLTGISGGLGLKILVMLLPSTPFNLMHPQHLNTKPFTGSHWQKWCTTSSPSRDLDYQLSCISPGLMPPTFWWCAEH